MRHFALALFLLTACGGPRSSPEGAVRSFLDALDARDTVRFKAGFTPGTREVVAELETLSGRLGDASGQPGITIEEWCRAFCGGTVEGSTLHGDSATVRVRVGNTVEELPLLRQDDEWRLDLEARYAPAVEMLRLIDVEGPLPAPDTAVARPDTAAASDTLP